jgi:hypothetical protein
VIEPVTQLAVFEGAGPADVAELGLASADDGAALAATVGAVVGAATLGAVDAPPLEQAVRAIDANSASAPRRLGELITR